MRAMLGLFVLIVTLGIIIFLFGKSLDRGKDAISTRAAVEEQMATMQEQVDAANQLKQEALSDE